MSFRTSALPAAWSGRKVGVLVLAALLGIALGVWPGSARAETSEDDQTAATESHAAPPGPRASAPAVQRARTGSGPAAAREDDDEDDDSDGAAGRKPSAAPPPARKPASAPQHDPKPETKPATARDEDDGEDPASRKPAGVGRKPVSAPSGGGKSAAKPVPDRANDDDDEAATDRRGPAAAPRSPGPSGRSSREVTKPGGDRGDDDDDDAGAEAPAASVDSAMSADRPAAAAPKDPCGHETEMTAKFEASRDYRSFVAGIVSMAPSVALEGVPLVSSLPIGGMLSGLVKVLWKDNSQSDLFDQMKEYVDKLIPDMIAREHVNNLKNRVAGFKLAFTRYDEAPDPEDKGQLLNAILVTLDEMQPDFFDPRKPEQTLAEFVAFGTLKLTALREKYVFGADYYGNDDPTVRAKRFTQLQDATKLFTDGAGHIRQRAMGWRLGKLHCDRGTDRTPQGPGGFGRGSASSYRGTLDARDDFCGWSQHLTGDYSWTACYNGGCTSHNAPDPSDQICVTRRRAVEQGFGHQLDVILEPTNHWDALAKEVGPHEAGSKRHETAGHDRPPAGDDEAAPVKTVAHKKNPPPSKGKDKNHDTKATDDAADTAGIVPCLESDDLDVQDGTTEAGIRCRRDNINKYLGALGIIKGQYSAQTLRTCLTELRSELAGGGKHEGCKPQRGTGTCYYRQLERCRKEAAREGVAFALSAASADDDPGQPEDADCNVKCAGDLIRRFMQATPEPAGQGGANPEPAASESTAEPADKEDN